MATALTPMPAPSRGWWWVGRAALEIALIAAMWVVYDAGRVAIKGQDSIARSNAEAVRSVEHWLHLPRETLVQHVLTGVPELPRLANLWYVSMHFPVTVAFLVFGFVLRPRPEYLWARNLLMTVTGVALVGHFFFPLAPPRMFPQWGFLDTMKVWGPDAYGSSDTVANQFAAMPSLHIGWALVVALVLVRTGPRKLAAVAVGYAAITIFVVVATANHWWLDGIVAALILALAVFVLPGPGALRFSMGRFGELLVGARRDDHALAADQADGGGRALGDARSARRS